MTRSVLRAASAGMAGAVLLSFGSGAALAGDGPTEALELRYHAEQAIAQERAAGHAGMAAAMQQALPDLLQEYLVTRDATVAMDAVDAAFVQEQFKVARAMEEPGVALALDVFSGPGTGYENELRSRIAGLAGYHSDQVGTVSEKALMAHERMMERQLHDVQEQAEQGLAKVGIAFERFDAKFDAKLDSATREFPLTTEAKIENILVRTETKVEAVVEKTESKIDQVVQVTEQKIEAAPQKTESAVERAEAKIEKIVDKAESRIDAIVQQAENKIDNLLSDATPTTDSTPSDSSDKTKGKK